MDTNESPARPNLEQYRKQAKDLVKAWRTGDSETIERVRKHHLRSSSDVVTEKLALADAQLVIAREHGFPSWPKFAKHIEVLTRENSPASLWESAQNAVITGNVSTLQRLLREHTRIFNYDQPPPYVPSGPRPCYTGGITRSIIAREHHFESWAKFARHIRELNGKHSPVAQFETAVDAIITGDVAMLERLLDENPELIRVRSTRKHHANLLHYIGANGIEGFRQKTPKNAVKIAEILLKARAEVDATAEMYGGSTTLGLVATSIHPLRAGVQDALIGILLDYGASLNNSGARLVNGCLANGRAQAAEFLAGRGAQLDLEGAAGVGRLDLVKSFFNEDGTLKANATKAQMKDGFGWACEFGRTGVVDFMLERGMEVNTRLRHNGQTGLHWAAYGGHLDTVKLHLERKALLDIKDESFGGTPVSWALYGWDNLPHEGAGYYEVVAILVAAGAPVKPEWLTREKVRADARMLAALSGELSR